MCFTRNENTVVTCIVVKLIPAFHPGYFLVLAGNHGGTLFRFIVPSALRAMGIDFQRDRTGLMLNKMLVPALLARQRGCIG